jgi:hypothetical protein
VGVRHCSSLLTEKPGILKTGFAFELLQNKIRRSQGSADSLLSKDVRSKRRNPRKVWMVFLTSLSKSIDNQMKTHHITSRPIPRLINTDPSAIPPMRTSKRLCSGN